MAVEENQKVSNPVLVTQINKYIISEDIHQNLMDAIIQMISSFSLPYYGEFCQYVNFYEAKIKTCGVNVNERGMNFYWGRKYVESRNRKQIIFTIIHEILHLLLDHQKRGVGYDSKIMNIAADMIIDSIIHGDLIIKEGLSSHIEIPTDEYGNNMVLFLPKEYTGKPILEELYKWVSDEYHTWLSKNSHKRQINVDKDGNIEIEKLIELKNNFAIDGYGENGVSGDNNENPVGMYPLEKFFESIDADGGMSFDIHFDDGVPDPVKRQFVESVMDKLKSRGLCSGDVDRVLDKLRKKEKDYLKEIKRTLSNEIFGSHKYRSISKINRRYIWGIKGNDRNSDKINLILDTSGSMEGEFEKALSYVFQNDIQMNLIMIDSEVKDVINIKNKKDLQKLKIKGLGGTCLTPALQYIASHKKLNVYNTVILTDGYVDNLDFKGVKGKTLILSTSIHCPIIENNGKVKQIIIDKENKKL